MSAATAWGVRVARGGLALLAGALILGSFGWVLSRPLRSAAPREGQVTLRILHWGDKQEDAIVGELIARFVQQNPGVRVQRSNTGSLGQLSTKLQTMLASGDPPDLFYLDFTKIAEIAAHDVLEDIGPYIERDQAAGADDALNLADFFQATLDAFRFDFETQRVGSGRLFGLAKDFTCVGFYYNKTLFDRAGVPHPSPDGWTWDEFIAAARAIGRLEGCYGGEFVTWESMVRIILFTHGLDVCEPGWKNFRLTDPAVVAVLEQLRAWFHDEPGRTLLSAKTQLETGQAPFMTGRVGLAGPFGRWQVPLYRTITDFDWDFAPLPHAAGRAPANGALTVAWAMAKSGRHKPESWKLMKFLLGAQGQQMVCEAGLAIPVLRSVAESSCFTDPAVRPQHDDVFLRGGAVARPIDWPPDPRFMDELKIGFENIYKLGRATRPELERVQRTWEKLAQHSGARPRVPWAAITGWIGGAAALGLAALGVWWWRARPGRIALREELAGLALISPWLIGFALFCAFPIVLSLLLGFSRWNAMLTLDRAEWVGFDNFRALAALDPTFERAVWITTWYALLAVPTGQLAALAAALLMNRAWRGISIFRAIWYLPSVLAGVGMAIMWKWVFHHEYGLLNALLGPIAGALNQLFQLGGDAALSPPRWFERDAASWGVPAFALLNLWVIGGTMMIYLAGLKGIPRDLYEAAAIDGAVGWQRFRNVTLPMLSPVLFFNTIMALIASFQIFTQVFVMTGGGPGAATHFYVYYLYKKAFDLGAMGYASAMAWILLLIVLALTGLIMRGTQRYVYYEGLRG